MEVVPGAFNPNEPNKASKRSAFTRALAAYFFPPLCYLVFVSCHSLLSSPYPSPPPSQGTMAPIGASPFRPRSRQNTVNRSPSPPPLPPKSNVTDAASSTGSVPLAPGRSSRRAFLCDLVIDSDATGQAANAMLSQLGQPLERPNCLPRATEPNPQSQSSYAEDIMAMSAAGWSASKQEEMERRLQSLMEELVRTENSYVSRILALQKVGCCYCAQHV